MKYIRIKNASMHNLKNISIDIPKDKLVLITGLSGSGKSTLAFDIIFAEGQRRYVESLSTYARQFLGIMKKPDVEKIEGISPTIAIEQRKIARNPRSTVGTVTEIYDYLRLLFARTGTPHCHNCGREISSMAVDEIIRNIENKFMNKKIYVFAPIAQEKKGAFKDTFKRFLRMGFVKCRIDGVITDISDRIVLDKNKKHNIDLLIDRLKIRDKSRTRLSEAVKLSLEEGEGILYIVDENGNETFYSEKLACPVCHISFPDLAPRLFSFNSPYGACPICKGLGTRMEIDPTAVIANEDISILEGAIAPWSNPYLRTGLKEVAKCLNIDLSAPFRTLSDEQKKAIIYGIKHIEECKDIDFEGVSEHLMRIYKNTESEWMKFEIEKYFSFTTCSVCGGSRLRKEALSVYIADKNIHDIVKMTVEDAYNFFDKLKLSGNKLLIAKDIVKEIKRKLSFLKDVGLSYISLDRTVETLSGGEEQRVRLATQIGSGLVGVIYVLDEPSIGLHPKDNNLLLNTLKKLKDMGNTVIIVEHDREFMNNAEHIIDMGPGAGNRGGEIVFQGTVKEMMKAKTITASYISGKNKVNTIFHRRPIKRDMPYLKIIGACHRNLKNINVNIPLGRFVCITGVSGSGKSTLVEDVLYAYMSKYFGNRRKTYGCVKEVMGVSYIKKVVNIDQSPIGRTPRSNPATYTKVFTPIRELFATLPAAKIRGYKPGHFSFNTKGGRCEACGGEGLKKIEMVFLPDIYVPCDVCGGTRYQRETLEIKFRNKNIYDILEMTVNDAYEFFSDFPSIVNKLKLLQDVGLGYIKLGQPATTLSGGEAQRIKLARELSVTSRRGHTFYILDEPTTGLHFEDIRNLLDVLHRLVDNGHTVLVIEHNMDVVASADYVIDLGPDGGEKGGELVAYGSPEEIVQNDKSYTARYLKELL